MRIPLGRTCRLLLLALFISTLGAAMPPAPAGGQLLGVLSRFGPGVVNPGDLVQAGDGLFYGTTRTGGTGFGTIFRFSLGTGVQPLYTFTGGADGAIPAPKLVLAGDGNLYGVAYSGGNGNGTIFQVTPNGAFTVLHTFAGGAGGDGAGPTSLMLAADGNLYGTTRGGGTIGDGTLFSITLAGAFTSIHSFIGSDGAAPDGPLVQGPDGTLCGTTPYGGVNDNSTGTVFRVTTSGALTTLHSFFQDGQEPESPLVLAADGSLYGVTFDAGSIAGFGSVFRVASTGAFSSIHSFQGTDGSYPTGGLTLGADGWMYGTTLQGGAGWSTATFGGQGTIYRISPGGGFGVLHNFAGNEGEGPMSSLLADGNGNLYGLTDSTIFCLSMRFSNLYSFQGLFDGSFPTGNMIQGQDKYLYGTTQGNDPFGLWKIGTDGSGFAAIYNLDGLGGSVSGVTQAPDGLLFGSCLFGQNGNGDLFSARPDGTALSQPLHQFSGAPDGALLVAPPVSGGDGYVYGGTQGGGLYDPANQLYASGVIYKMAEDGSSFQVLHTFSGPDGSQVLATLLPGANGYLYGATQAQGPTGAGTLFRMSRDGASFRYVPSLNYGAVGNMTQAANGAIYGTTDGATDGSVGLTVFKVKPDLAGLTTLTDFAPFNTNNPIVGIADWAPRVTVNIGPNGQLYGSTVAGGPTGSLYRMAPDGSGRTTLYPFSAADSSNLNPDGAYPLASLIGSDGNLYGFAYGGGPNGFGTIFKLTLIDTSAPTTTAILSQVPNAAGWNNVPLTVTLYAVDDPGGAGVQSITLSAAGAKTIATKTVKGASASVNVDANGVTTLTFFATDLAGNAETPKTLVVMVDTKGPHLSWGTPSPSPNAAGWNNTPVSIPYTTSDATSGVASASPGSPLVFSTEGATQSQTVTVIDVAGNLSPYQSQPVNIDMTPPVTTASAAGSKPAIVTLTASDTLSGVATTYYYETKSGTVGPTKKYQGPITINANGTDTVTYWSVDVAGNVETANRITVQVGVPKLTAVVTSSGTDGSYSWYVYIGLTNDGTAPATGATLTGWSLATSGNGLPNPYVLGGLDYGVPDVAPGGTVVVIGLQTGNANPAWIPGKTYKWTFSGTLADGTQWTTAVPVTIP